MIGNTVKAERAELAEQEAYWKEVLSGDLPYFNFQSHSRPPVPSFLRKRESAILDAILVRELEKLCSAERVESSIVLLAVFKTLLLRYTDQEDVIVGTLFSDSVQEVSEQELFTNPVALRTHITGETTVRECLRRVQVTVGDAAAHRDYPFGRIIEMAGRNSDLSCLPVFQVMCIFLDTPLCDSSLLILEEHLEDVQEYTTRCDLVFVISRSKGELQIDCEFDAELFEQATIARLLDHFRNLLQGFIVNPESCVSTLTLLTEEERYRLVVEWNDTKRDYPKDKCIHQLFEEQVERTPDAVAVVFEEKHITYRDLNAQANQLTHHLQNLGVGPEVCVGICVERSLELVVAVLGVLKAGGAYVPLDPSYPAERLAFTLQDAQVSVLLTQQHLVWSLPEHQAQVLCLDAD